MCGGMKDERTEVRSLQARDKTVLCDIGLCLSRRSRWRGRWLIVCREQSSNRGIEQSEQSVGTKVGDSCRSLRSAISV